MAAIARAVPTFLKAAPTLLGIGGTFLGAKGKFDAGSLAQRQAYNEADQLETKAGFTRAISQRNAVEHTKQAELVNSRAKAVAAASGGGASDPTIINMMARTAEEGLIRSLNEMASGESEARYLEKQAKYRREEGDDAKKAGKTSAISTILSGGSKLLMEKYG